MSSTVVRGSQRLKLDGAGSPDETVTPGQVSDHDRVARVLNSLVKTSREVRSRFWPARVDFEDIEVDATGTKLFRLYHGFGKRVRWYVVDWSDASYEYRLVRHSSSDLNTLVLVSYAGGIATIRVEEAGS